MIRLEVLFDEAHHLRNALSSLLGNMMRRSALILIFTLFFGEFAMATDPSPTDEYAQLKSKVEMLQQQVTFLNAQRAVDVAKQTQDAQLTQAITEALKNQATAQLNLINTQIALDTAKQTQESQLAKAVADALKNQAAAQFSLEAEQAKGPFAELSGIKAATSGMQLPTGKSGTVQVAAGTSGTALLRSKGAMLRLLDTVANDLARQLPNGAVIVTESQLEQAYQAGFTAQRIEQQTSNLAKADQSAKPAEPVAKAMIALPTVVAAAYSAGLILDTVNSLGKLFRVDRKVDVFAADIEAGQMLGYLLEAKGSKFIANPAVMRKEVLDEANSLLKKLTDLSKAVQDGESTLAQLKKLEDEGKSKPDPIMVADLNAQLTSAKSLFDGLDPSKKPDQFWTQVRGQLMSAVIKGRDRLLIEAKGQALQITESRWFASDRMNIGGEVQVAYRILNQDGGLTKAGVILKASKAERTRFDEMPEMSFPEVSIDASK